MSIEKFQPSYDIYPERIERLKNVVPEAFADGKINWEILKESLGSFSEDEGAEKEHYAFTWPGKREARRMAGKPPQGTLVLVPGDGVNEDATENIFIEGDNLEVLKLLQKSYAGKVKVIYIDPPYNTGNDFVYNDNFTQPLEEYYKLTGQIDEKGSSLVANKKSDGRFHSKWLNMIYPRLLIARNLLKKEGAIFISIDDNELINLRRICDEIFGEENHVATLTVINNLKGRNDKANVATCHEYLVIYGNGEFESYGLPLTEEQMSEYKFTDENGEKYALRDLRKRGRPDRREDRPKMFFPIYYNKETNECHLERKSSGDVEIFPKRGDNSDGRWRWGKDKVEANLKYLHPRFSKQKNRWDIDHRVYLNLNVMIETGDEETDDDDMVYQRTSKSKSFWWGSDISTDVANREFKRLLPEINPDYPKSPFLIEKILHMTTKDDDLIIDFFSGYSTTAQAILTLNHTDRMRRRFILIQWPEVISEAKNPDAYKYCITNSMPPNMAELGKERIRKHIPVLQAEDNISKPGFKVFKLQGSHFNKWRDYKGSDVKELMDLFSKQENALVAGWKPENLIIEVMLQEGFPLHSKIELMEAIKANKVVQVKSEFCKHVIFICLDEKVDKKTIEQLPLTDKDIFICLDSALTDEQKVALSDKGVVKTI